LIAEAKALEEEKKNAKERAEKEKLR